MSMNALLSFCLCFTVMADIVCLTNIRVACAVLAAALFSAHVRLLMYLSEPMYVRLQDLPIVRVSHNVSPTVLCVCYAIYLSIVIYLPL